MEAPTSADFCSYLAYIPIYPGAEAFHHHGGSYPQQLNQALPTGDSEANVHLSVSHVSSTLKICFLKSCRVRHVFFSGFNVRRHQTLRLRCGTSLHLDVSTKHDSSSRRHVVFLGNQVGGSMKVLLVCILSLYVGISSNYRFGGFEWVKTCEKLYGYPKNCMGFVEVIICCNII